MLIDTQEPQGAMAVVTSFIKRKKWRAAAKADPAISVASKSAVPLHFSELTAALDGLIADASLGVLRNYAAFAERTGVQKMLPKFREA